MMLFPGGLRIGDVAVTPATVLAPMAGVTDTVFRRFIRELGGCGLIMTEFASSHGVAGDRRRLHLHRAAVLQAQGGHHRG
jgi:tRNA-dihydrouridine synthase